jgi:membrane peptidoglycan carboxypeptidase
MGNADNTAMANNAFSSAGAGPMWQTFMKQAHEYLKIPKNEFPVPKGIVSARCAGRTEIFVKGETPTKPGACRAPSGGPSGGPAGKATPTPDVPRFDPRTFPTPTPTPEATPTPVPSPAETPTPATTPGGQDGGGGQGGGGPGSG